MNALLVDFVRRWWWALLAGALVSVVTAMAGYPLVAAPLGGVLLLLEAQQGGIRVMRCLPVRTEEQGLFCWIVTVLLTPVLCMAVMLPTTLLRALIFAPDPHLWFRLGIQAWVALGYSALIYLLIIYLPSRPGETARENLAGTIAGALWGLSIAGFIVLFPNMPRTPQQVASWHWVLFASVPFLVLASVALRNEFLFRRATIGRGAAPRRRQEEPWQSSGRALTGVPLFLATVPTQAVGITFMVFVFQLIFLAFFLGNQRGTIWDAAATGTIQTAAMGIMFASFTAMWVNLRSMRVLPISSRALAALLLSPALGVGVLTALFMAVSRWGGSSRSVPFQVWDVGLLVFGFAAVGLVTMIRYPKVGVFLLIGMMSAATPLVFFITSRAQNYAFLGSVIGIILVITGYLLLVRILRDTSSVYRPPTVFAMGGYLQQGR
ncbi:MAG: hypothetical protein ACO1QR_03165 [Chthoniobacteraceae bacterium]